MPRRATKQRGGRVLRRFFLIPDETGRLMWPEDFEAHEAARESASAARSAQLAAAADAGRAAHEEYSRAEWELAEYGFENDGYDYAQHFRTIGGGTFVTADGEVSGRPPPIGGEEFAVASASESGAGSAPSKKPDVVAPAPAAKDEEEKEKTKTAAATAADAEDGGELMARRTGFVPQELDDTPQQRALYRTARRAEEIDADVVAALESFADLEPAVVAVVPAAEEEEKEEKEKPAEEAAPAKEPALEEMVEVAEGDMPDDFVAQMLEDGECGEEDFEGMEFSDMEDEEEEDDGERRPMGTEEQRMMEEALEDVMEQYSDSDIGALSGDEGTRGTLTVQEILQHLEAAEASERGSMPAPKERPRKLQRKWVDKVKHDEDATVLPSPEDKAKTLELLRLQEERAQETHVVEVPDAEASDEDAEEQRWDCESVLSLRSTSSYVPTVLGTAPASKSKKKAAAAPQPPELPPQIRLSQRTGMPLRPEEEEDEEEEDEARPNLGERRKQTETAEERRARKKAVKEAKRERREQKKETKKAYKAAEVRQARMVQAQSMNAGGQPTFRL